MIRVFLTLLAIASMLNLSFAQRDTTYFIYENLGPSVNSEYNESGPRISPDGSTLFFFRTDHPDNGHGTNDIWVSDLTNDSVWSTAKHVGDPLNNYSDNCVHSISADGNALLVHDIYLKNKTSKSGVSISRKQKDGSWSFPEPLKIKKYKNTSHLTSFYLSDDWETLILAIETEETIGKQDLYVSFHDTTSNTWSTPEDLGATINSTGAEATAFLAGDQKTLYFSSDGHPNSLGGVDIYKSVRQDSSWKNWSKPENIGAPYNTADDEFYFSLPAHAGGWAYLAHSHHHGHSDITRIKKVVERLPAPLIYVHGHLINRKTMEAVHGQVHFFKLPEYDAIGIAETDSTTEYITMLKGESKYEFKVHVEGFEEATIEIDLMDAQKGDEKEVDIFLTPIDTTRKDTVPDDVIVLDNIEFETAKWDILDEYVPILENLYSYLSNHPEKHYEIAGHTDNVGKEQDNQVLSENRAQSVVTFLVNKGIKRELLEAKGYGELVPVTTNDTEEGRRHNRRVELVPITK